MKIKTSDRLGSVQEYYFSAKLREIAQLRQSGIDIINLGVGSPDMMPSQEVIEKLRDEALSLASHGYQSYMGVPELRKAHAQWYKKKFGVSLNPNTEILPLIGSKEGIMHISMTYVQDGDVVLVPDPGYPTYRSAARLAGATVIPYDLKSDRGWLPDLEVLDRLDLTAVKMMWINYPHMPSGTVADREMLRDLVTFATKHEILLCHDNPYAFILNENPVSLLSIEGAKEVSIELTSLSKTFNMAGWRLGFMTGHQDRVNEVLRFKSNMDSGMFKPIQMAAVEALQLPESWYRKLNESYRLRRRVAEEIVSILGCTFDRDQVGMFLWAEIPREYKDGIEISEMLLKNARVFITPGNIFGENGKRFVRISLCNKKETLEEALDRIKQVMSESNISAE